MNQEELNRPPNVLLPFRNGVRFDPARLTQLTEAINRQNTGIQPPAQVLPDEAQAIFVNTQYLYFGA